MLEWAAVHLLDGIILQFRKAMDFRARTSREEFWWLMFAWLLVAVLAEVLNEWCRVAFGIVDTEPVIDTISLWGSGVNGLQLSTYAQDQAMVVYPFVALHLPFLLVFPALMARRLHDVGMSAWWLVLLVTTWIGALVLIGMALVPGTLGANRFGSDPRERLQEAVEARRLFARRRYAPGQGS